MTNEEYFEYMDRKLSEEEKQLLIDNGWLFSGEDYIYASDVDDESFSHGIRNIRNKLLCIQYRKIYFECKGNSKDILEAVSKLQV